MSGPAITVHGDPSQGGIFRTDAPHWRAPDHRIPARTCSYCGSIHPEDLVALRDAGQLAHVDRSVDWKYGWPHKIYIDIANPDPAAPDVIGSSNRPSEQYRPYSALNEAERAAVDRDPWHRDRRHDSGFLLGTRATLHAKFYNVHQVESDVTPELRAGVAAITGYLIEPADDGRIRWRRFDYSAAA